MTHSILPYELFNNLLNTIIRTNAFDLSDYVIDIIEKNTTLSYSDILNKTIEEFKIKIFNDLKDEINMLNNNNKLMTYANIVIRKEEIQTRINNIVKTSMNKIIFNNIQELEYTNNIGLYSECSICIENFKENDKIKKLHCGHCFHTNCINAWTVNVLKCPNCRYDHLSI
jgi:Ring finger domain